MRTILVSGANRGLGLAYVEELLNRGRRVLATARRTSDTFELDRLAAANQERLTIYRSDLNSEPEIEALFESIYEDHESFDGLINNAGVFTENDSIDSVILNNLLENFFVNAAVPTLMAKSAIPFLMKGDQPFVVNVSSSAGSIELKTPEMERRYSYSMSKAALNMSTRTLAYELAAQGITVVALHPGSVRGDIGGPDALLAPSEVAPSVINTIESLHPDLSGSFVNWDGRVLNW